MSIKNKLRLFWLWFLSTKAGMGIKSVIMLCISLFVAAIVFPLAMTEITGANTTGWNAGVTTVFTVLLPVLGVIAIAVAYIKGK